MTREKQTSRKTLKTQQKIILAPVLPESEGAISPSAGGVGGLAL
ncbi:MAG: hypothetical protein AAGG51_21560 [Cyanobacteria bacterium P01_G01_bin.54]